MKRSSGKVQRLILKRFTAFEKAAFEFCPGVNVIIGANSTGKTLTIKIVYTILRILHALRQRQKPANGNANEIMLKKLRGIFQLRHVSDLIRHCPTDSDISPEPSEVNLQFADTPFDLELERKSDENVQTVIHVSSTFGSPVEALDTPPIYLPAQEILSINQGFISLYQNRELPYDETFYDLSLALNAIPLRGERLADVEHILALLKNILAGEANHKPLDVIVQENNRFYFNLPDGRFETHFVAEGFRKVATLHYLLRNGSLNKNSILLWDEPEANLNPKLIVQIVEVLKQLASAGVQIFVTTHDYLLSHELSLVNEYQANGDIDIKFFALNKPDMKEGVTVESSRTLAEIEHNPILEEFAAHYDRETIAFQQS